MFLLPKLLRRPSASSQKKQRKHNSLKKCWRVQLWAEPLEDRTVPSVTTVTYGAMGGWAFRTGTDSGMNTSSIGFVNGPATPPLGAGSLQFATGSNGDSFVQIGNSNDDGALVSSLTQLSYSTYVQQNAAGSEAPYLVLNINTSGGTTTDDQLLFEPTYQSSDFFPSNPQGPLTTGTWQTWDALNGGWYSVNGVDGSGPGVNVKSLSAILDAEPGPATFAHHVVGGVVIAAGEGGGPWNNFIGNADNFNIKVDGNPVNTYDFEPTTTFYVNSASAGTAPGTDPDGAGPAQAFGFDSFATIQDAVNAAANGDTIIVEAAATPYTEAVNVNKSVTLEGANAGVNAGVGGFFRGPETEVNGGFGITAANVTIDGFTIDNGATLSGKGPFGVVSEIGGVVLFQNDATIENTIFTGAMDSNSGVIGSFDTGGHIQGTTIQDDSFSYWQTGIQIDDTSGTQILHNRINNNTTGIETEDDTSLIVQRNMITANSEGIVVFTSITINGPLPVINLNNIMGNTTAGLDVSSDNGMVDATNNFWGTPSGPTIASNPNGRGDAILETTPGSVNYQPFLNHVAVPFEDLFTQANGSELSLAWQQEQGFFTIQNDHLTAGMTGGSASVAILSNLNTADTDVEADITASGDGSFGLIARYSGVGSGPAGAQMYWGGVMTTGSSSSAQIWVLSNGNWHMLTSVAVASASGHYRFEVFGSSLQLVLNGVLVGATTNTALTTGSAGVWGPSGTTFDNFFVQATPFVSNVLPFNDTFTQSNGSSLSSSWTQVAGSFTIQSNQAAANAAGENFAILNNVSVPDALAQADITLSSNNTSAGISLRSSGTDDLNQYWGGIMRDSNGNYTASIWLRHNGSWIQLTKPGVALTGFTGSGTVRFEAYGSDLKLFVNGNLVTFTYDTTLATAGAVGIWGSGGTTFDNFHAEQIVPQNATLPFTDNFTQANGSDLNRSWRDVEGAFEVANDKAQSFPSGSSSAILNGVSLQNVTVSADATLLAGAGSAGVTARESTDGQNEYWGGIVARNGVFTAELWVKIGGNWTMLAASAPLFGFTGEDIPVRMEVNGSSLQLFVNGSSTPSAFATDTSLTAAGSIGIWASLGDSLDNFSADAL